MIRAGVVDVAVRVLSVPPPKQKKPRRRPTALLVDR
jgi:hypothetical protein